jgi:hypothetical protein
VDDSNDEGIWSEGKGSLALVTRSGNQIPGVPSGTRYHFLSWVALNEAGETAFPSGLNPFAEGIWSEGSGSLAQVASTLSPPPGVPSGVTYSSFDLTTIILNNAGQTAFQAFLTGNGVDGSNYIGIWSESSEGLSLVARTGNQAPGTPNGVNFSSLNRPVLNDAGKIAFLGGLAGIGVDSTNFWGVWSNRSGNLALVARAGEPVPGMPSGIMFSGPIFGEPVLNSAGRIAFRASLSGNGVDSTNNQGIWHEDAAGLTLLVREGSEAPGTLSGVHFGNFPFPDFIFSDPVGIERCRANRLLC